MKPKEWLGEAISLTRQLSEDLSPLDLREGGLAFAILSLSSQVKDRYGLDVELIERFCSPVGGCIGDHTVPGHP